MREGSSKEAWVVGFILVTVIAIGLAATWSGGDDEAPPVEATAPIVLPLSTVVVATSTPSATPFPAPARMKSDVLAVSAPVLLELSYDEWFPIQLAFPPREQYRAARTAWCESRFDVGARGKVGEAGWFQIHPGHFGRYVDGEDEIDVAAVGLLTDEERQEFWVEPTPWLAEVVDAWFPGASRSYATILAALTDERVGMHVNAQVARTLHDAEGWAPWSTRNGCAGWQG